MKLQSSSAAPASVDPTQALTSHHAVTVYSSQASIEDAWRVPQKSSEAATERTAELNEPLLQPVATLKIPEHHVRFAHVIDDKDPGLSSDTSSSAGVPYIGIREHGHSSSHPNQQTTVVDIHDDDIERD